MSTLLAIPLIGAAVMLQTTVVSRFTLLQGPADIVLLTLASWSLHDRVENPWRWALVAGLMVGWVSALPIWIPILGYLVVTALARSFRSRVWQIPILALFTTAFLGTVLSHSLAFVALQATGTRLDLLEAFNLILLPSLLLNLLFALPVHGVIGEIAQLLYPSETTL